jgi:hypothetical protein
MATPTASNQDLNFYMQCKTSNPVKKCFTEFQEQRITAKSVAIGLFTNSTLASLEFVTAIWTNITRTYFCFVQQARSHGLLQPPQQDKQLTANMGNRIEPLPFA